VRRDRLAVRRDRLAVRRDRLAVRRDVTLHVSVWDGVGRVALRRGHVFIGGPLQPRLHGPLELS
jgi:hypothetical protein